MPLHCWPEAQNLSLNLEIISCWAKPFEKLFESVTSISDAASTEGDVLTKMIQDEWYTKLYIKIEVGCWITVYALQHYTYQWYPWWDDYSLASLWAEIVYHQLANSLKIGIPYPYISIHIYTRYTCDQDVGFIPEPSLFAKSRDDSLRQLSFTCPAGFLPSIESWYQTPCADVSLNRHDLTF